jgi:hypothetical protein
MAQVSQRTGFSHSALVRLLQGLAGTELRAPRQASADQLSQWFGWTDAISLSAALDGNAAAPAGGRLRPAEAEARECLRVRSALAKAIAEDGAWQGGKEAPAAVADFAPYRRRYLAQQQALDAAVGSLRGRLRAVLAGRSPAMARLAAVDVVMEQVLAARERSFLASVPGMLEKHFGRLRTAGAEAPGDAGEGGQSGAWLEVFHGDIRNVLLAELDFRFQPVEGLLEALRMRPPGCHE